MISQLYRHLYIHKSLAIIQLQGFCFSKLKYSLSIYTKILSGFTCVHKRFYKYRQG